jgi:hypothetical protein
MHMYYGRVGKTPRMGVMYFMIDEHINRIVEKSELKFNKLIQELVKEFRLQCLGDLQDIKKRLKKLTDQFSLIKKEDLKEQRNAKEDAEKEEIKAKLIKRGMKIK